MSLSLCILASGSAGNCSVVRSGDGRVLLVDAGLSPKHTAKRLDGTGVRLDQIEAICLTHLDWDHFRRSWIRLIKQNGIRVFCGPRHRHHLLQEDDSLEFESLVVEIDTNPFEPVRGLCADAIELRHDEAGSHGFVFAAGAAQIAYATDLGRVPPYLIDRFCGVDVLAIESNYDVAMQLQSLRPQFLKTRIMGGRGHLSNREAFDAVKRIFDRSHAKHGKLPSHVVLLHRSQECNCPKLLQKFFSADKRFIDRLVLAEQDCRTEWLCPTERPKLVGEQLMLMWA
jgi:phosphoribosyl 1,2-cyclic phosphodiesterase